MADQKWDAIVIGGGPAGALVALDLARRGRRVVILEKSTFPRFHVGESLLPATLDLLKKLGLEEELRKLPHVKKFGADFVMGNSTVPTEIDFSMGYCPTCETFNIERCHFDDMLLREAKKAGAIVRENSAVSEIVSLKDGDVRLIAGGDEIRGQYLLDASGQACVVARHLGIRQPIDDGRFKKVAYFNHFENVWRADGKKGGNPLIVMSDEAWFWLIPITETRTSIGMVLDADVARTVSKEQSIPADRMLAWGIDRCPAVLSRLANAKRPETNNVISDYSYRCRPYAGDGYFLVGDSAAFIDPIFSTGIFVGAEAAMQASRLLDNVLASKCSPEKARREYCTKLESCASTLFHLIGNYYDHAFRELFLQGQGPLAVHKAMIGVLAGNVFPRPPFKVRWRLRFFEVLMKIHRRRRLVPRRRHFSILKQQVPVSVAAPA